MAQTYGQAIESLQQKCDKVYDSCEALRDCATLDEKEQWNNLRGLLSKVNDEFHKLSRKAWNNKTSDMQLDGNY